jgi:hypothetical protein
MHYQITAATISADMRSPFFDENKPRIGLRTRRHTYSFGAMIGIQDQICANRCPGEGKLYIAMQIVSRARVVTAREYDDSNDKVAGGASRRS